MTASQQQDMDGAAEPQRRVHEALRAVGEVKLARPAQPTLETGGVQVLADTTRAARASLDRAADDVVAVAAELARNRGERDRHAELMTDLTWRVSLPVAVGLIVMHFGCRSLPVAIVALATGSLVGIVVMGLGAYVYRALLPSAKRAGLANNDAALVVVGTIVALYAAIALIGVGEFGVQSNGARFVALVVCGGSGYLAHRRFAAWKSLA